MKKIVLAIFFLSLFLLLHSFSFAQHEQNIVITKGNFIQVYQNSDRPPVAVINRGEIYTLLGILSDEVTSKLFYKIKISADGNYAYIDASYAKILEKNLNVEEALELAEKYYDEIKNIKSTARLEKEIKTLKQSISNWNFKIPIEYEIVNFISLLRVNSNIYYKNYFNDKLNAKNKNVFIDLKSYLLSFFEEYTINDIIHSEILCEIVSGSVGRTEKDNYSMAKKAFDLYPSQKSSSVLLIQMANNPKKEDEQLIDKIINAMRASSSNNSLIGFYYERIGNDELAIIYYKEAELLQKKEKPSQASTLYDIMYKSSLAELLSKSGDYEGAAIRYIELDKNYSGYAFRAAYNAHKTLENGGNIPGVDIHTIIDLYKKSDDPSGYYNAGLIYVDMKSPRNVRLMAEILRKKFKDIESANTLFDAADQLGARLKGHNP